METSWAEEGRPDQEEFVTYYVTSSGEGLKTED
jgi:hypothetical protein